MVLQYANTVFSVLRLLLLAGFLAPAVYKDLKERIIPNRWCVCVAVSGAVLALLQTLLPVRFAGSVAEWTVGISSAAGLVVAILLALLCRVLSDTGLGWGDVKLMSALGLFQGASVFLRGMALTGFVALAVTGALLLTKKVNRKDTLPFAPFLAAGALGSQLWEVI